MNKAALSGLSMMSDYATETKAISVQVNASDLAAAVALLKRVPVTADGVLVAFGQNVYALDPYGAPDADPGCGFISMWPDEESDGRVRGTLRNGDGFEFDAYVDEVYSSAAALAARGGGEKE